MTDAAREALIVARERGVALCVEAGAIRYVAPAGALDPALRAALVAHRSALIALLDAEKGGQSGALVHDEKGPCTSACTRLAVDFDLDSPLNEGEIGAKDAIWCTGAREKGGSGGIQHLDRMRALSVRDHRQNQTTNVPEGVYAGAAPGNRCTSAPDGPKAAKLAVESPAQSGTRTGTRHFEPCTSAPDWPSRHVIAPVPTPDTPTRPCACAHPVRCLTRVNGDTLFVCLRCHVDPITGTIAL